MEGIKEAIAYITGLAVKAEDPKTVEINGKTYCTKDLVRYDAPEKAAPISATTLPLIEVAGHIPAEAAPEILAHELAHIVTVGDEHGPEWKKAFEAIYSKYNELAIARFGAQEPEENQKGGD